jgi:hypothetical protein
MTEPAGHQVWLVVMKVPSESPASVVVLVPRLRDVGQPWSLMLLQSSSTPLQTRVRGPTWPTQETALPLQVQVPASQMPTPGVPEVPV